MRRLPTCLSFAGLGVLALAGAASAQAGDRYGSGPVLYATPGSRFAPVAAPVAAPVPPANRVVGAPRATARVLSWPGKTAAGITMMGAPTSASTVRPSRAGPPAAQADQGWIPVSPAPARTAASTARLGPPLRPWTQRFAAATSAPSAPPPVYASATPNPSTGAPNGGARYYSLHRAYGMTPDAAPIPPQFFGPTADLGAPETADAVRRANATAAAVNTARLASETAQ